MLLKLLDEPFIGSASIVGNQNNYLITVVYHYDTMVYPTIKQADLDLHEIKGMLYLLNNEQAMKDAPYVETLKRFKERLESYERELRATSDYAKPKPLI